MPHEKLSKSLAIRAGEGTKTRFSRIVGRQPSKSEAKTFKVKKGESLKDRVKRVTPTTGTRG